MGLFSKEPLGLFGSGPKVRGTISSGQWTSLQRRAQLAESRSGNGMFTKKAVASRKASDRQRSKSIWS